MNVAILKRKFPIHVKTDWKDNLEVIKQLPLKEIERIIDVIDSHKDKKSIKELAIVKYEGLPIFITILFHDYIPLLIHFKHIIVHNQMYEVAGKVRTLEKYLMDRYYVTNKI